MSKKDIANILEILDNAQVFIEEFEEIVNSNRVSSMQNYIVENTTKTARCLEKLNDIINSYEEIKDLYPADSLEINQQAVTIKEKFEEYISICKDRIGASVADPESFRTNEVISDELIVKHAETDDTVKAINDDMQKLQQTFNEMSTNSASLKNLKYALEIAGKNAVLIDVSKFKTVDEIAGYIASLVGNSQYQLYEVNYVRKNIKISATIE